MKPTIFVVLLLGVISLTGCSIGADNIKTLEDAINTQLPQKIEESGQGTIKVSKVACTADNGSDTNYSCVASVNGKDSEGNEIDTDLQIKGTCTSDECKWETK